MKTELKRFLHRQAELQRRFVRWNGCCDEPKPRRESMGRGVGRGKLARVIEAIGYVVSCPVRGGEIERLKNKGVIYGG